MPKRKSIFMRQDKLDDDPLNSRSHHQGFKSTTIDLWQNGRTVRNPHGTSSSIFS